MLEKTLKSPLDCKEIQPVHPKGDQSWIFTGRTHAEAEAPILWPPDVKNWLIWKYPTYCWERFKAREEGDDKGWDGWMASPTYWTWVWVNSGSWWWTGRPGMLQSTGSQSRTQLSDWTNWNYNLTKWHWGSFTLEDFDNIVYLFYSNTQFQLDFSFHFSIFFSTEYCFDVPTHISMMFCTHKVIFYF